MAPDLVPLVVGPALVLVGVAAFIVQARVRERKALARVLAAWDTAPDTDRRAAFLAALRVYRAQTGWEEKLRAASHENGAARRRTLEHVLRGLYERADGDPDAFEQGDAEWVDDFENIAWLHVSLFADEESAHFHLAQAETCRAPLVRIEALDSVDNVLLTMTHETLPRRLVERIATFADGLREAELRPICAETAAVMVAADLRAPAAIVKDTGDARARLLERCRKALESSTDEDERMNLEAAIEMLEPEQDEDAAA